MIENYTSKLWNLVKTTLTKFTTINIHLTWKEKVKRRQKEEEESYVVVHVCVSGENKEGKEKRV